MLHIEKLSDGLSLFKALGSEVRLEIVRLLVEEPMNMNELAGRLHITNGALTTHIRKLEECGVVAVSSDSSGHGRRSVRWCRTSSWWISSGPSSRRRTPAPWT